VARSLQNKWGAFNIYEKFEDNLQLSISPITTNKSKATQSKFKHLRSKKEIEDYCDQNNLRGSAKIDFLKEVLKSKHPDINPDILIYKMMCVLIEWCSASNSGDYLKGKGMYQKDFDEIKSSDKKMLLNISNKVAKGSTIKYDEFSSIASRLMRLAKGQVFEDNQNTFFDLLLHPFLSNVAQPFGYNDNFIISHQRNFKHPDKDGDNLPNRLMYSEPTIDSFIDYIIRILKRHRMKRMWTQTVQVRQQL
jgi:hypothetical protein